MYYSWYNIGRRFASPAKPGTRAERAKGRADEKYIREHSLTPSTSSRASRSITPFLSPSEPCSTTTFAASDDLGTAHSGEDTHKESEVMDAVLLARIEMLESENLKLRKESLTKQHFRIEDIQDDDKLISFYTGFVSFMVFSAFFEFLGPVVHHLNYWGSKEKTSNRSRRRKLDSKNQLFLVLVKLKLNLKLSDLSYRFGLSTSQISRYITTWICFLYHHLKEIDWMPSVKQVRGTLPTVFREKFPSTYVIIDGSEVFIETPSDLAMQSSTWSQYKHHNTVKFLVACTPNGAICFVSPVYVGSISDVELTKVSGFLDTLKDKPGVSVMADKGFTIRDLLQKINVNLNIPAFLNEKQLSAEDVDKSRKIASVRIHVERAIGRIKTFQILKGMIPISMARLTNQIIFVCCFLTNFFPALVPLSRSSKEESVEEYFQRLSDSEISDMDSDSSSE